jgi:hypothetical protein
MPTEGVISPKTVRLFGKEYVLEHVYGLEYARNTDGLCLRLEHYGPTCWLTATLQGDRYGELSGRLRLVAGGHDVESAALELERRALDAQVCLNELGVPHG